MNCSIILQADINIDDCYHEVQKQLALYGYLQETVNILSREIFLFGMHDQHFLLKCLSEASTDWTNARIR